MDSNSPLSGSRLSSLSSGRGRLNRGSVYGQNLGLEGETINVPDPAVAGDEKILTFGLNRNTRVAHRNLDLVSHLISVGGLGKYRDVMVSKIALRDRLRPSSEFDPLWVLPKNRTVPHTSYA